LLILGITGIALIVRRKRPYVVVGWFWYLLMLSPVLGIVQAGRQAHADRFTYLPQIGLCVLVTWTIADWTAGLWKRREILAVAGTVAVIALASVARTQAGYWQDSELLWSHAIAVTKNNAFAHASLADLLLRRGRQDEAILHCREALKLEPGDADAHNNLGLALLQKGHENEAATEFRKSLEIDPHQMNAAPNLAWILATSPEPATRDGAKAVELAERVLQHAGHPNAIVLRTLAAAYAESGRFPDAINAAEQASQLAMAQGNVGLAEDLQRCIANYRMGRPLRSYVGGH
jgi:tetratricopeptide (TPR) repeat protein